MNFLRVTVLALFLIVPAGWAQVPATQGLTLDQALALAQKQNPRFKAAQAKLAISEASIRTASGRLNPGLLSDNGFAEKTYRLGLEQTFELGGKRGKRIAIAQSNRDVVLAELALLRLGLRVEVRRAYTQLYNNLQRQQAIREIVDTTELLLNVARKREQAGDIAQLDVMQADITTVNARNDLQGMIFEVVKSRNTLNSLLNQPLPATMALTAPGEFLETPQATATGLPGTLQGSVSHTELDLDHLLALAYQRRPEFLENQRAAEVAMRQRALALANRIPNVHLTAGYDHVSGSGGNQGVFLIGSVELPVFNRQQGPLAEAAATSAQLALSHSDLIHRVRLEVSNAYYAYMAHQQRIQRYETDLLPKAQVIVDKSRRSFEEGKSVILTPIYAHQAYINTRLGYLQALQDSQDAISDLELATGIGL